jgi:CHAT domain-containing protein
MPKLRGGSDRMRCGIGLAAALVVLFYGPRAASAEAPEALRAEAFAAAQWAMASDAADALAKVAARFARGEGPLAELAERRERLVATRSGLERRIEALYAQPGSERDIERAGVRARYGEVVAELKETEAEIDRVFPDYAELISPKPLTIADVQRLLKPDEALLLVLVNEEAAYVWGVTREQATWARADGYGVAAVGLDVFKLRAYLAGLEGAGPAYDRGLAFKVYDRLVRPVEAVFAGKTTLISVTGGSLATLPLGVLVTDPKGSGGWLVDRYALASLPAVSSLRALRCQRSTGRDRPEGCPKLAASAASPRAAPSAPTERISLVAFGAPAGLGPAESRGRGAVPNTQQVFRGALADPAKLQQLASLPGSAVELRALKGRFPAGIVLMGQDATESAVRVTFRQDLARSRYVVFSTHGLMAGQLGNAEPGLVLTPPSVATEADDGYLTASEAAQLRLSADFVVLSACNTAASDGSPGGQGLSGLARSFFYAGARSVLVSHWEVFDVATVELVKATFDNIEGRDLGSRARALQHAAQQVRANPRYADPSVWGAFTLVGEPER